MLYNYKAFFVLLYCEKTCYSMKVLFKQRQAFVFVMRKLSFLILWIKNLQISH